MVFVVVVTVMTMVRIVMLVEKSVIYGMFEWIVVRIVMRVVVAVMMRHCCSYLMFVMFINTKISLSLN